jgi:hypothetical protein
MPMIEKLLLWGIGAIVLAIIGLFFLLKAKKQIKKLDKDKK